MTGPDLSFIWQILEIVVIVALILAVFRLFTIAATLKAMLVELRIANGRESVTAAENVRKRFRGVHVDE